MADVYTAITDFDWDDKSRPEVQLHDGAAIILVGGHHLHEIADKNPESLRDQLEGWAEIFAEAAKQIATE